MKKSITSLIRKTFSHELRSRKLSEILENREFNSLTEIDQ